MISPPPPRSTRSDTFFFPSPASANDWVSLCWGLDGGQPSGDRSLDGRPSAGNWEAAKKTEAPSTGCLRNMSLSEHDENVICFPDRQLPK